MRWLKGDALRTWKWRDVRVRFVSKLGICQVSVVRLMDGTLHSSYKSLPVLVVAEASDFQLTL